MPTTEQPLITWIIRTQSDDQQEEAAKLVQQLTSQALAAMLMKRALSRPPVEAIATPNFLVMVTGEELRDVPPFGRAYAFVCPIGSAMADDVRRRLKQIEEVPSAMLKRRGATPLSGTTRIERYDPARHLNK